MPINRLRADSRIRKGRRLKLSIAVSFAALLCILQLSQHLAAADSSSQERATDNPLAATEANLAQGLDHFRAHCATCHADTGKADNAKGKQVGAADLTSRDVQSKSDASLFNIVSNGMPGTAMPAFGKTHQKDEIWSAILFLRKLPTLTPADRMKLEAAIPSNARHDQSAGQDHDKQSSEAHHHHAATPPAEPAPAQQHQHEMSKPDDKKNAQPPEHQHPNPASGAAEDHSGHNMDTDHGSHSMASMMTTITGGPFKSMHAIGSGTSLLPSTTPGYMWHWMKDDWMIAAHGDIKIGFNHQGGPRGVNKAESQNWLMLMAERPIEGGRLMLRGMFSAEPWTAPRRGFPELFQTGETFEGRPIIDAQHPHDLFMELAAQYTLPLSENVSINLYGGPVAEPALGPVAFMHRASAAENPAAPLSHHWQDSTHIAHGVFTAGVTAWRFKVEGSIFRGAEPDQNRKDIELGKLDSYSGRIWFTPTPNWVFQFSRGHLTNPEAASPGNLDRTTASVSYNRSWSSGNWASSLIWGRNHEDHGNSNAYLFESTANLADKNYLYTRLELVDKAGLLEENIFGRRGLDDTHHEVNGIDVGDHFSQSFRVGAFAFGAVRDIVTDSKLRVGIGADVTFYRKPEILNAIYGSNPTSFHLFVRIRPGKMEH